MQELNPLHSTTWRLFLTAHTKLLDRLQDKLAAAALPPLEWYDVLLTLKEGPSCGLRLRDLADRVLLSRSNLTRLIDRLEAAGLLRREQCPSDRRGLYAVLNQAGLEMQQQMWAVYAEGIAEYFGNALSTEEAEGMHQALSRILTSLEAREPLK